MFKLEKLKDKAILTIYGFVGGYFLDFRQVRAAIDDIVKSGYSKLDFHIHTYGGSVFDGNLIYNFISSFKGEVDVYIDGIAASMGSIIVSAGTRIHIADNGFIMIHCPSGYVEGTKKDLISYAGLLESMEKTFKATLMKRTKKTDAEVEAWFDGPDHWFDADQCVALGLADDKFGSLSNQTASLDITQATNIGAKAVYDCFVSLSTNFNQPNNMDKKAMIARYKLTGVDENSTEDQILAAIDAKISASENAAKATMRKSIEASVDAAIEAKKIKKDQRDSYIERGEKVGLDDLNAIFADMNAYQPVAHQIHGKTGESETGPDRKDWTWDDFQAKAPADLEKMAKDDSTKFNALYKAKYNTDPE